MSVAFTHLRAAQGRVRRDHGRRVDLVCARRHRRRTRSSGWSTASARGPPPPCSPSPRTTATSCSRSRAPGRPGDPVYNRDYQGEHSRRVIALDIQKLLAAGNDVECAAPPVKTDADGDHPADPGPQQRRRRLPDRHRRAQSGFAGQLRHAWRAAFRGLRPRDAAASPSSNYFVQLTPFNLPGTHEAGDERVCMARLTQTGKLVLDTAFKDELTGRPCVSMDRPMSYCGPTTARPVPPSRTRWRSSTCAIGTASSLAGQAPVRRLALLGPRRRPGWPASRPPSSRGRQRQRRARGQPADFHLVDPAGRAYSLESFPPDSVLVIYFGYTTCLRACPTALDNIAAAVDNLGAQGARGPAGVHRHGPRARRPAQPAALHGSFGPSFLGLTGPPDGRGAGGRAFKVQVERIQFSADPGDYAMTTSRRSSSCGRAIPSRGAAGHELAGNHRGRAEEGSRLRTTLAIGRRRVGP